jgi:transcriptional regulator with XRE-family HTH domain
MRSGVTQQQLADLSTISTRTIRDLEKGRVSHPRRETVRLLADALRVDHRARQALERSASEQGVSKGLYEDSYPSFASGENTDPNGWLPTQARFEYKTLHLKVAKPSPLSDLDADVLNEEAKSGWRLITVDAGIAFLERGFSEAYSASPAMGDPEIQL